MSYIKETYLNDSPFEYYYIDPFDLEDLPDEGTGCAGGRI